MLSVARAEVAMRYAPRIEMALLLIVSGLAALLASYGLLRAGLSSMAVRYPLSAAAGYIVFIFVLRVWVRWRHVALEAGDVDLDVAAELVLNPPGPSFGSRRLSGSIDADTSEGSSSGWDLDDLVFIAVLVAMVVSLLVVLCFVLVEAPALFAEAIVDSAIVTGLYKRLGPAAEAFWVERVVAHTWKSILLIAVVSAVMGWAAQYVAPNQATLGGVIQELTSE
jgi:hypothetical protein